MSDWNSGPTYSLFGFNAAQGSPLGSLFAWAQGVSTDYDYGLTTATGNPGAAVAYVTGQPVSDATLINAYQQGRLVNPTGSPFVAAGNALGTIFGTGVGTIGGVVGIAGNKASPGVASGASQAGSGLGSVGAASVVGGLSGTLKGVLSGIGVGLDSGSAGGATGGADSTYLYVAGAIALVVLYLVLS